MDISTIENMTFDRVEQGDHCNNDAIFFVGANGEPTYMLTHMQDCCEHVEILDIDGDLSDLADTPITHASERTNEDDSGGLVHVWTFYHIWTNKGSVVIRFYGQHNGYYSASADLYIV